MFEERLSSLKSKIKQKKLDAFLISDVVNIIYLTGFENFSKDEREAYLLIGPNFQYLITDARYSEAVKNQVPNFKVFERGFKNKLEDLFKKINKKVKTLGVEEDNLTVSEYKFIKKYFPKIKNFEVERIIKNEAEIKKIETACKIGDLLFDYILKKIKVGVSEKQIASEMEKFVKEKGVEFSFSPIVAFSKNSSIPHHQTGETKLEKRDGQFVLLDFGVNFQNYCSDMTRTIFFGKPDKKKQDIYQAVLDAQTKAINLANEMIKTKKPLKAEILDKAARDYIESQGYSTIPHSVGHGIGLEVHELPHISPRSEQVLKEGMVFSIEPGVYIEGFGGVRIEDLFVIESDKLRQLTTSKKQLFEL